MNLQTGHLEDIYHAQIILFDTFLYLSSNLSFNCVLELENQEGFSESCSLISGVP